MCVCAIACTAKIFIAFVVKKTLVTSPQDEEKKKMYIFSSYSKEFVQ